MGEVLLKIYDFLRKRRWFGLVGFLVLAIFLVLQALSLSYREDITDFLPLDPTYRKGMSVYQDINSADRLIIAVELRDTSATNPERLTEAVDLLVAEVERRDTASLVKDLTAQADFDKLQAVADFVYGGIPYFLTENDYVRMDSLMTESAVDSLLSGDKQLLMLPVSGLFSSNIGRDPLGMFTPAVARLQNFRGDLRYALYDTYIFSEDFKRAIVAVTSPFGANETDGNAALVALLDGASSAVEAAMPDVRVSHIGVPSIAVANANRIKADSVLSISVAIVLIMVLLMYSLRSARSLLLIFAAIAFGWLFGVGAIAMARDTISVIVLGIGSVIIGIAVNYPLHYVAHFRHNPDARSALKELVAPLVIGNVTTVGAFLTLVPLNSVALRDLGLFSSFMLVGTILFVLIFLPHLCSARVKAVSQPAFARLAEAAPERKKWVVVAVGLLTVVFAYFSFSTSFDANMQHINYMTPEQRSDFKVLQSMAGNQSGKVTVYVASEAPTLDEALAKSESGQAVLDSLVAVGVAAEKRSATAFLPSSEEQERRLQRWEAFKSRHKEMLTDYFCESASRQGFGKQAFSGFEKVLSHRYEVADSGFFAPLSGSIFRGFLSYGNESVTVVDALVVEAGKEDEVHQAIASALPDRFSFDVAGLNSAVSDSLSDEFNYIGWACGVIVFLFLWFTFGRLELSIVAFLPMAVGWIWILGIMQLLGIQFNIVNIILATFIFGQGDDYSIFMTEGLMYEHTYRRKILSSYKSSIIVSALIMFVGIGALIVAEHPALRSLAEVTVVGMVSVVLMTYLLPPFVFGWLVRKNGTPRDIPVTLSMVFRTSLSTIVYMLELLTGLILGFILFKLLKKNESRRLFYHRCMYHFFRMNVRHIPGVEFELRNPFDERFDRPAIIICNHQSILDPMCFMMLTPKVLVGTGGHVWRNRIIHRVLRFSDFFTVADGVGTVLDKCRDRINAGYSIAVYPEGERSQNGSVLRFHTGAFYLAEQLDADVLPLYIHGMCDVMPKSSAFCYRGKITVEIGRRIAVTDKSLGETYQERTKAMRHLYERKYSELRNEIETARYFRHYVRYKYLYKGMEVERSVRRMLRKYDCFSQWVDGESRSGSKSPIVVVNNGIGVVGLLFALVCRDRQVVACEADGDKRLLAASCSCLPQNLRISQEEEVDERLLQEASVYVFCPTEEDRKRYEHYKVCYIEP